jgi:lipoate-protein ligase A
MHCDKSPFLNESRSLAVGNAHPTECRLIIDPPAPGAWNMAVDEALLIDAAENTALTLRFYEWSEPTLSLGYFQRYADREQHPPSRNCAMVRRPTGGGAILHDRELTYSLTVPRRHPIARHAQQLYAAVHDAFIAAIKPMIAASPLPGDLVCWCQTSSLDAAVAPFLCFQRQAPGDVVLLKETTIGMLLQPPMPLRVAWKILGSAQRRHHGAVLQHGSLLLQRSPAAPELPGLEDLTGAAIDVGQLANSMSVRFAAALEVRLTNFQLPPALKSNAQRVANSKYGTPSWTNRR